MSAHAAPPTPPGRSPEQNATPSNSSSEDLVVASNPDLSVSSRAPPANTSPDLVNPTPRTPHRVRFALDDDSAEGAIELIEAQRHSKDDEEGDAPWLNDEDYAHSDDEDDEGEPNGQHGTRPLLTGITAPSTIVANDLDSQLDNRPKSGMRMAFMNMANSIIGAGIIGIQYPRPRRDQTVIGFCRTTVCVPTSGPSGGHRPAGVSNGRCA
jgi:hypothetical protein